MYYSILNTQIKAHLLNIIKYIVSCLFRPKDFAVGKSASQTAIDDDMLPPVYSDSDSDCSDQSDSRIMSGSGNPNRPRQTQHTDTDSESESEHEEDK